MKKLLTLPIAIVLLTACSDNKNPQDEGPDEAMVQSYLSMSIVTPKSVTRDDVNDDDYTDGNESENTINNIRFYFFYDGGDPVPVNRQGSSKTYLSYIDWIPTSTDFSTPEENNGLTVEKIVTATLGINMPANNNGFPDLVLAVLNPTDEIKAIPGNPTLETLTSHVADYYTGLYNNNFVITNSVYSTGELEPELMNATPIKEECFQPTPEEAIDIPLIIYVERVLSRLDFGINMEGFKVNGTDYTIYHLSDKTVNGAGTSSDPLSATQQIYVRFLGWNVTRTTSASYLVKNIDVKWRSDLFGNYEEWNIPGYHRSFWAINPPEDDFEYNYGSWQNPEEGDGGNYATALPIPSNDDGQIGFRTTYLQENAAPYELTTSGPVMPSEVIVGAQLVDINGNPLTLVNWANRYYTSDGIKNTVATALDLYTLTDNGYEKISPSQLEFKTSKDVYGSPLPDGVADYYVYVQLTEAAQELTWYNSNTPSASAYNSYTDVNQYIINRINYMMVWNSGQTYYYFEIKHLGGENSAGYYGVVRNHLYKAVITSVEGLGTPVYDPDQTIIPEKPDGDQSVLSVDINILQWRVVANEYQLIWP